MFSIGYAVYLFVLATFLALLEVQIEGPYGWAEKAPCWRPNPNSFVAKSYARIMSDKPLTGYHIAMFSLVFIILHFPFLAGVSWTLVKELEVFSTYFLLAVCWDFLWFVWHPKGGLKKFKPKFIWWHKHWIKDRVPTDYPSGLVVSLFFALIAVVFGGPNIIVWWGVTLGILTGLTLLSCLISQLVRKGQT